MNAKAKIDHAPVDSESIPEGYSEIGLYFSSMIRRLSELDPKFIENLVESAYGTNGLINNMTDSQYALTQVMVEFSAARSKGCADWMEEIEWLQMTLIDISRAVRGAAQMFGEPTI